MDKDTRNRIQRATQAARRLLEDELAEQLGGVYDIRLDGTVADTPGAHLREQPEALRIRTKLVTAVQHHRDQHLGAAEAVAALQRECAFTTLNRFVALKMLEARGLVQECVSRGAQSSGFKEFCGLADGLAALPDKGYHLYLDTVCDEIGREVRVLFDRRDPASLLWPRKPALDALLELLNDPELAAVWGEDETIGWVYQYFNGDDERKQMRSESQAPRNSRELAVRNQFFTPRYVVEFLTDNTLARTWVEMRRGETRLVDECRYLVKRPAEVFLDQARGGFGPCRPWVEKAQSGDFSDLPDDPTEDELDALALAFHGYNVAERLRGQDFAAFMTWVQPHVEAATTGGEVSGSSLDLWLTLFAIHRGHRDGPDPYEDWMRPVYDRWREALRAEAENTAADTPVYVPYRAPKDPRDLKILDPACGSGHFLLYAFDVLLTIYDEAWGWAPASEVTGKTLAEDYPDRAALRRALPGLILRHNLHGVDIDPRAAQIAALALWMRAQRAWNDLGLGRAERPLVTRTNVVVAEPMPGEADLLDELCAGLDKRVASVVRDVFEDMKLAGEAGTLLRIEETVKQGLEKSTVDGPLFAEDDAARWARVERQVYDALRDYAEGAGGASYRKRLFAEDAARGFAFIDLCRQQYDVVLMNPPFGAGSLNAKSYLQKAWPRSKNDIYATFVERGVKLLPPAGFVGAITSRTGFFLKSFQRWRQEILLGSALPTAVADLGGGVLDGAMVETAAYCLRRTS